METAKVRPMANQILCHISNTPSELIDFCQKSNIVVEAYSPIAHGEILNQPEIKAMADKYKVSLYMVENYKIYSSTSSTAGRDFFRISEK